MRVSSLKEGWFLWCHLNGGPDAKSLHVARSFIPTFSQTVRSAPHLELCVPATSGLFGFSSTNNICKLITMKTAVCFFTYSGHLSDQLLQHTRHSHSAQSDPNSQNNIKQWEQAQQIKQRSSREPFNERTSAQ